MQTLEEIFLNRHKIHLTACLPASSLLQGEPTKDQIHALRWKQTLSLAMVNGERNLPKATCPTKSPTSLQEMFPFGQLPRSTERGTFPRQLIPPNLWLPSWRCSHLGQQCSQPTWSFKPLNCAGLANSGLSRWTPFLMQLLVSPLEFPGEMLPSV